MPGGTNMNYIAIGVLISVLVAVDYIPRVNSGAEDVSSMKMSTKMMGPTLKFLYCYS